ncbi:hypothetical protein HG536_0A07770 [Torulaspora globosa]|uniref:Uncharacterized protein n=1 Tax=Torulaspora globosa TaxID=48254 RepID=A0A7G3ZBS6_9SACH|nr:uncharacterized protein HG536_0A07770 [Torulaspora globosa]QLL30962.1 hypothetical protein HG536_0A07770 [Torulaspora globosa]
MCPASATRGCCTNSLVACLFSYEPVLSPYHFTAYQPDRSSRTRCLNNSFQNPLSTSAARRRASPAAPTAVGPNWCLLGRFRTFPPLRPDNSVIAQECSLMQEVNHRGAGATSGTTLGQLFLFLLALPVVTNATTPGRSILFVQSASPMLPASQLARRGQHRLLSVESAVTVFQKWLLEAKQRPKADSRRKTAIPQWQRVGDQNAARSSR